MSIGTQFTETAQEMKDSDKPVFEFLHVFLNMSIIHPFPGIVLRLNEDKRCKPASHEYEHGIHDLIDYSLRPNRS